MMMQHTNNPDIASSLPYRLSLPCNDGMASGMMNDMAAFTEAMQGESAALARNGGAMSPFASVACDDTLRDVVRRQVTKWRDAGFTHLVLVGTGGASLGARALLGLPQTCGAIYAPAKDAMRISIMENADPHTAEQLLATLNPAQTAVLVISKSGRTVETLSYFYLLRDHFARALSSDVLGDHFTVLTDTLSDPDNNPLYQAAVAHHIPRWDHASDISGRYSVFSAVGLLPAAAAGLDIDALHKGAASVLSHMHESGAQNSILQGAALHAAWAKHYPITVLMPYGNGFRDLGAWYRQLWAESLGKSGKGTTPICFQGAVDQHSQLQLYLEGPQDKCYSFVLGEPEACGPDVSAPSESYLAERKIGDVLAAQQRSTVDVFMRHDLPARHFIYRSMDEQTMGALMMHWMMETVLIGRFWGVDPFDQPAVEEGKILARQYLS